MATGSVARALSGVVSLTYDGTQSCHIDVVLPCLERYGLTATFFADPALMLDDLGDWQTAAQQGHEIGNGCLLAAALPDGSLPAWTIPMVADDVAEADALFAELFPAQGQAPFAFPVGSHRCAEGKDYSAAVHRTHQVCRVGEVGYNFVGDGDARHLKCLPAHVMEADHLIAAARAAIESDLWAIFAFGGVGSGERPVSAQAHEEFCRWLAEECQACVAPMALAAASQGMVTRPVVRVM